MSFLLRRLDNTALSPSCPRLCSPWICSSFLTHLFLGQTPLLPLTTMSSIVSSPFGELSSFLVHRRTAKLRKTLHLEPLPGAPRTQEMSSVRACFLAVPEPGEGTAIDPETSAADPRSHPPPGLIDASKDHCPLGSWLSLVHNSGEIMTTSISKDQDLIRGKPGTRGVPFLLRSALCYSPIRHFLPLFVYKLRRAAIGLSQSS
ncbi:hypothetical protein EV421DRAFT_1794984 [Armillaria borealis]|uniref:Uncharacterized protein n=1 Tax=Armillaria borealis TaxID=47425 RepID=A0AA39MT99_9AGAR|nr:hypothetical protein EV421DRAFT_1794984 [Armillaria borealis]